MDAEKGTWIASIEDGFESAAHSNGYSYMLYLTPERAWAWRNGVWFNVCNGNTLHAQLTALPLQ